MIEISRYDIHTLQAVFGWGSCIWDREIGRSEGQTHVSQIGTEEGENRRSIVHVLKVWGNWLGYPISFSTPSWPPSWAGWRPGLLELFLDGSTKNTPNQLAGSTKLPLFKKIPQEE